MSSARRILLHGVTGSGKTMLARRIADALNLPMHSVDDEVGWLTDWVERPRDEQRRLVSDIVSGEEWVLDSSYRHWRDLVLGRADLVVALDYRRMVSLRRLLARTARRVVTSEVVCNGNTESLHRTISSSSIIVWHFRSFGQKRGQIATWAADPTGAPLVRLRRPQDAESLIASL